MGVPAPAESSQLPSTDGSRGALQAPQTASGAGTVVSRVVRVPLERPDDADWRDLVALAREGAQLANGLIAAWWAEAHGWTRKEDQPSAIVSFKGRLSGDAYVAIQGEAQGVWRRLKARVMRRDQRLPAFASDRSLVVRGRYSGGAGGVRIVPHNDSFVLRLLLKGREHGSWQEFSVWAPAIRKDRYLSTRLTRMASGHYRCSKVTLQIDQRHRKLYALCAIDQPVPPPRSSERTATLILEPDGSLLLRSHRQTRDFTREAWEIRSKKEHYEGIVRRFRRSVGRGPRWRQIYKRNLPPTYEQWSIGKLHQLSAEMVNWLVREQVSRLTIRPLGDGDWPAHRLESMLRYKCEQQGIAVDVEAKATDPDSIRADAGPVRKEAKKAARVKQIARLVKSDLTERTKRGPSSRRA